MLKKTIVIACALVLSAITVKAAESSKEIIYSNSFEVCPADIPTNVCYWKGGAMHNWNRDTLRAVANQPPFGEKSLQIDMSGGVVIHALINLADDGMKFMDLLPGKTYSFSLYAKADREDAGLSLGFGWGQSQTFKVGTEWKRLVYHFTPKKEGHMLRISVEPNARYWIDAVQVEAGNASAFKPDAKVLDPRCNPKVEVNGVNLAADTFKLPVKLVEKAPVMDGKLDDPCWDGVTIQTIDSPRDGAKAATQFKVVSDGRFYYLAVTCHEPNMQKIVASQTERNSLVYTDDSLEIFLKGSPQLAKYYHFMVNSKGVTAQEECKGTGWGGGPWWKAKTSCEKDRWNAEIQLYIPFNYGGTLAPDTPCLFNLCRNRLAANEYLSWHGEYHRPATFAALTGVMRPGPLLKDTGFDFACGPKSDELRLDFDVKNISGKSLQLKPVLMLKEGDKETLISGSKLDISTDGEDRIGFTVPVKNKVIAQLQANDGVFRGPEYEVAPKNLIRGPLLRYHVYAPRDKKAEYRFDLSRLGKLLPNAKLAIKIIDLFGKVLWTESLNCAESVRGQIPLDGLNSGMMTCEASVLVDGKILATTTCPFWLVDATAAIRLARVDFFRRVMVCDDGPVTGLCGAYLFPFREGNEILLPKMDALKGQGATVLYIQTGGGYAQDSQTSPERLREVLDMAAERGLKCVLGTGMPHSESLERYDLMRIWQLVKEFKNHPAVLGYDLSDEVEPKQLGYLSAVSPLLQNLDPGHPMSMNLNHVQWKIKVFGEYQNGFTLVDHYAQPYQVYYALRDMRRVVPWNAFYFWAKSYSEGTGRCEPTPKQFLAGAYAGIVNGASIIAPFTYRPASTDLWNTWKTLSKEMETIKDALATEDFMDVSDSDGVAGASWRKTPTGDYVIAISLIERTDQKRIAKFMVPGFEGKSGTAKVLFENRDVLIKNGVLEDLFALDDRRVYYLAR